MRNWAIIVAGGSSTRTGGTIPKQFRVVRGRPMLSWTISRFESASCIDSIIVVGHKDELTRISDEVVDSYSFAKVRKIVAGGESRQKSVLCGLEALPSGTDLVAIHDGARPLISPADISRVVEMAALHGAAMLAQPATDTIKRVTDSYVESTIDRESLYYAQTPQVFKKDIILEAHREYANREGITDDAMLVELYGKRVMIVEPTEVNMKVTTENDFIMIEVLLEKEAHV